jgi:hypothetical protein
MQGYILIRDFDFINYFLNFVKEVLYCFHLSGNKNKNYI